MSCRDNCPGMDGVKSEVTEAELYKMAEYAASLPSITPPDYVRTLAIGVLNLIDQRDRLNLFILEMAERYSKQSAALIQAAMKRASQ